MTKYYKQHLLQIRKGDYGTLYKSGDSYFIGQMHYGTESVTKVPNYIVKSLDGIDHVTDVCGPYIFINGFEDTPQARYLINMLPYYFGMRPRAQEKVDDILKTYRYWVRIDKRFLDIMRQW